MLLKILDERQKWDKNVHYFGQTSCGIWDGIWKDCKMFLRRIFLSHLQSSPQYLYFKLCNSYFCVFVILYFCVYYFCIFMFLLIFLSPALLSTSCQYLKLGRLAVVVEHFSLSLVRLHFCIFAFLYSVFRLVQFWVQRSRPKKKCCCFEKRFWWKCEETNFFLT